MEALARLVAVALTALLVAAAPAVARPGDVDSSFGTGGEVFLDFPNRGFELGPIAPEPGGGVIAGGVFYSAGGLIRVDDDGAIDEFGSGGTADTVPIGGATPFVQADGKIVSVGSYQRASGSYTAGAVRFLPNGLRDSSYGSDGVAVAEGGPPGYFGARASISQADGGLVLVGTVFDSTRSRVVLTRFDPGGRQDRSFGDDGWVTAEVPDSSTVVAAGAEDPGGKLVVAGEAARLDTLNRSQPPVYRWTLLRFNRDGALDKSFDGDGIAQDFHTGSGGGLTDLAVQADGKPVLGGSAPIEGGRASGFSLARANTDGSRDTSFNGDGLAQFPAPVEPSGDPTWAQGAYLAVQSDGKLAAVGQHFTVHPPSGEASSGWVLIRLTTGGELDPSFGDGGWASTAFGPSWLRPSDLVRASGGQLVVAGSSIVCNRQLGSLIRFHAEDTSADRPDAGPAVRVCDPSVTPEPDGDLPVELQCPVVDDRCSGIAAIEVPAAELTASRAKRRPLRVGSRYFRLRTARPGTVTVRASKAVRKLLAKRHKLRAVAVLTAKDGDGHRRVTRRKIVIRR